MFSESTIRYQVHSENIVITISEAMITISVNYQIKYSSQSHLWYLKLIKLSTIHSSVVKIFIFKETCLLDLSHIIWFSLAVPLLLYITLERFVFRYIEEKKTPFNFKDVGTWHSVGSRYCLFITLLPEHNS